jgi:hypothetical protein
MRRVRRVAVVHSLLLSGFFTSFTLSATVTAPLPSSTLAPSSAKVTMYSTKPLPSKWMCFSCADAPSSAPSSPGESTRSWQSIPNSGRMSPRLKI